MTIQFVLVTLGVGAAVTLDLNMRYDRTDGYIPICPALAGGGLSRVLGQGIILFAIGELYRPCAIVRKI